MVHWAVVLKSTVLDRNHLEIMLNNCKKLVQIAPFPTTALGRLIKQRIWCQWDKQQQF